VTRPQHDRLLAYAAQHAKARPEYLGWVLAQYIEREQISEDQLARYLRIAGQDLPHLALCLRPRAEHFADDVRQISAKFHIDSAVLATVVRLVESVEALAARDAGEGSADSGLLIAARARKHPRPHQDGKGSDHDHAGS
jgi:hypothetical protein